jgi:predicted RNA-binding protein associated with RNAse of E/G family
MLKNIERQMNAPEIITNGAWQSAPHMIDYHAEWFSEMLVERATWSSTAPVLRLGEQDSGGQVIAQPGYVWFRFWLLESELMLEKYFDAAGKVVGFYVPISLPLQRRTDTLRLITLVLGLWLQPDDRVTVLREAEFDQAVIDGAITPVEAEQAELRIRELTLAVAQKRFPPAMVRNFTIRL